MTRFTLFIATALLFSACKNKKVSERNTKETAVISTKKRGIGSRPYLHTDTLQFIYFEGNFDYWSCLFLNSEKDTINMVTDSMIADGFKNRLFEVKWFTDTLYEAGDNGSKYAANRMSHFRPINGKPFVAPITEEQILRDVRDIPEVQSGADQVRIAEKPDDGKNYYLVETGTRETDNFSRFLMFRVYIYPQYVVRVYDPGKETDISLNEWRERDQE